MNRHLIGFIDEVPLIMCGNVFLSFVYMSFLTGISHVFVYTGGFKYIGPEKRSVELSRLAKAGKVVQAREYEYWVLYA